MDSLTHVLMGAALGEVVLGKKVGNKAMIWGAIGCTLPDADMIGYFFMNDFDAALFHRGFTHSFLFCLILAPALGYAVHYLYRTLTCTAFDWAKLFVVTLLGHILMDYCTAYGTELLWPFSRFRFTNSNISVFDPLFLLPLLVFVPIVLFLKKGSGTRKIINILALILSVGYLGFTIINNQRVLTFVKKNTAEQNIKAKRYFTTPTIGNNLLWNLVAETDDGFYTCNYSILSKKLTTEFYFYNKNHDLAKKYDSREVEKLKRFSSNFYAFDTISIKGKTLVNDFRFGQFDGYGSNKRFIFSFDMQINNGKTEVLQIKPPRDFDTEMLKRFWNEMLARNE